MYRYQFLISAEKVKGLLQMLKKSFGHKKQLDRSSRRNVDKTRVIFIKTQPVFSVSMFPENSRDMEGFMIVTDKPGQLELFKSQYMTQWLLNP